jgi:hypothetical protein
MNPTNNGSVEPIVRLLFYGILIFLLALFFADKFFANDGQIFQAISGLLAGFSGAFFARIKPSDKKDEPVNLTAHTEGAGATATVSKTNEEQK